ncbi:MAG: hypothetical protein MOP51_554 [Citricoccus sp.]|nr:hypothetical protein [Citricoccus sp. WCRC_4]
MTAAASRRTVSTARTGASRAVMNIGEVLGELKDDFPQASASKIRFLEE